MRLTIQDVPVSGNKLLRMHWAVRSKYNQYWQTLVRSQINNGHRAPKTKMKVQISQMRKRKLDKDNLYSSVKPLVDALKYWKLIRDDSPDWIELDVVQTTGPEKITVINIEAQA